MRVEVMKDEYSETPIDQNEELCKREDAALGLVVESRSPSHEEGHVHAWGDVRIIARAIHRGPSIDITAVRIHQKSKMAGEYPREVGMKVLPRAETGDRLQIRKVSRNDEEIIGVFVLSDIFSLWGNDEQSCQELLPDLWKKSEIVFELVL